MSLNQQTTWALRRPNGTLDYPARSKVGAWDSLLGFWEGRNRRTAMARRQEQIDKGWSCVRVTLTEIVDTNDQVKAP